MPVARSAEASAREAGRYFLDGGHDTLQDVHSGLGEGEEAMRASVVALICFLGMCWAGLAMPAAAIPYVPPPQPIYDAPIDRALANIEATTGIDEAQREQLLGRLNLLAYARDDGAFAYRLDSSDLVEAGSVPCADYPEPMPRASEYKPQTFTPDQRCAQFSFALGPQNEIPQETAVMTPRGRARLLAAERHYARAVMLDGDNLRARLGHAYALDRLHRMSDARRELRAIITRGLPKLAGEQSDWEDHAVLTEAAEHLAHIARSRSDQRRLTQLRARLEGSRPIMYVTPVVVPLTDAPFDTLVDNDSPIAFDFAGTGDTQAQGWLRPDAAWLVWDPEWRGQIRSGFDLIGQRSWAVFWRDGFEALRALDDNRDGELSGGELGGLSLWRDENSNGVSDPGEVTPVNVHGIAALSVNGRAQRPGLISAPAGVRFEDGRTRPLYDWTPGLERRAPVS